MTAMNNLFEELLKAARNGDRDAIERLLQAGAEIGGRSEWWAGGFGVLDVAAPAVVSFLIEKGAPIDTHAAARLGMMDVLQRLLDSNLNGVHRRGADGQLPLHFASSVAIADYLLQNGADMDAIDIDHESTAAQYMVGSPNAVQQPSQRHDVARYLIARGCRTDILMAAALGDRALVRKHLDAHPESIRVSVSERSFPKQNGRSGGTIYIYTLGWHKTPHQVAKDFGHEDVYQLLMERSPAPVRLSQACEAGDRAALEANLTQNPNVVSEVTQSDRERLPHAAANNSTEAVRMMLVAGWPIQTHGQHGGTALHWAAWHGNAELVLMLTQHQAARADTLEDTGNQWEMTPLEWAFHGSLNSPHQQSGDYPAVTRILLEAGAKVRVPFQTIQASDAVLSALWGV